MKTGFWADYQACFRGPYGWTMFYVTAWGMVVAVAMVWLTVGLFEAETTRDQILYATGCLAGMMFVTMIKLYTWMQMMRVATERRMMELLGRRDGAAQAP